MSGGFALLAALFGGAYWSNKYSSDVKEHKMADRNYQRESQSERELHDRWFSSVVNSDIETELEDGVASRDCKLIQEINDTWHDFFDCIQPEIIYHSERSYSNFISCFQDAAISDINALRILMANRGLLRKIDAEIGMSVGEYGATTEQKIANYSKEIKFIMAIDEKLGRCHGEQEIYVQPFGTNDFYLFPPNQRIYGRIKWRPMVSIFELRDSERRIKEMEAWK